MGWSIDIVRPDLNKIFREADRYYRITHPQQPSQGVVIEHLGDEDLQPGFKKRISNLFPEFVYVEFVLVQLSQVVADQMEWDNNDTDTRRSA